MTEQDLNRSPVGASEEPRETSTTQTDRTVGPEPLPHTHDTLAQLGNRKYLSPQPPTEVAPLQPDNQTSAHQDARKPSAVPPNAPRHCPVPAWSKPLYFVALLLMANQVKWTPSSTDGLLATLLSKIGLSDIAFLLAFLMTAALCICKKLKVQVPLLCIVPILAMAVTNVFAKTGLTGCLETAQMAMFLLGGITLFAFLHRYAPSLLLVAVTVAMLGNLAVAVYQDVTYGAFLTLAPKDVIELSYGFGNAVTGLFRSKIAFSLYLGTSLAWVLPQWLCINCKAFGTKLMRDFLCLLLAIATLFYITNPFLAGLTALIILIGGFSSSCLPNDKVPILAIAVILVFAACCPNNLHVSAWKHDASILKGYDYVPDASLLFNQPKPKTAQESYENAAELKSAHYDFIAALRLAADNPSYGVGSGNYQKTIGKAFALDEDKHREQLPDPTLNDLETDSQAGWGILAATLGVYATAAFILLFCATLGANAKRHMEDMEDMLAVHHGATLALVMFIIAMFYTNPLTRGLGWGVALAMASAETSPENRKVAFIHPFNDFSPVKLIAFYAVAAIAIVTIAVGPVMPLILNDSNGTPNKASTATRKTDPTQPKDKTMLTQTDNTAQQVNDKSATQPTVKTKPQAEPVPPPTQEKTQATPVKIAPEGDELFLVFNADYAASITMPMRRLPDPNEAFTQGILVIPDKAGVPPPGQKPALKHGGAVFTCELKQETTVYLWCNVMWDGSCGNTLDVKVDDDKNSYTVGNDGTYNAWHWQRSPKSYRLAPGKHSITVLNREDGIKLAQLLLVNDKEYVPEGIEEE